MQWKGRLIQWKQLAESYLLGSSAVTVTLRLVSQLHVVQPSSISATANYGRYSRYSNKRSHINTGQKLEEPGL